jgi:hypothetical protein
MVSDTPDPLRSDGNIFAHLFTLFGWYLGQQCSNNNPRHVWTKRTLAVLSNGVSHPHMTSTSEHTETKANNMIQARILPKRRKHKATRTSTLHEINYGDGDDDDENWETPYEAFAALWRGKWNATGAH